MRSKSSGHYISMYNPPTNTDFIYTDLVCSCTDIRKLCSVVRKMLRAQNMLLVPSSMRPMETCSLARNDS